MGGKAQFWNEPTGAEVLVSSFVDTGLGLPPFTESPPSSISSHLKSYIYKIKGGMRLFINQNDLQCSLQQ